MTTLPPSVAKNAALPVDRAREDRREDDDEDSIERGLARERALMSDPDHDQGREENDNTTQRDLNKGQVFRLRAQTKKWPDKIKKCIHTETFRPN